MDQPLFSGACTALVTPFLNDEVNYPMLEQLLRRQLDAGIRAIVIGGTTGESATLSERERLEMIRRAKSYTGGAARIIAGTGTNATFRSLHLSRLAQEAGADALLLVSPYYNKANPEGLFLHFSTIAAGVGIPCILYNVPSRTGVDIPIGVYRQLSRISNIAGVKEAGTDLHKAAATIRTCGSGFSLWSGNDDLTLPVMALGGKGVISVLSNLLPGPVKAMCDAMEKEAISTARAIHMELLEMMEFLFSDINPIPIKYAMQATGFDCGPCRLPLTGPDREKRQKFARLMEKYSL